MAASNQPTIQTSASLESKVPQPDFEKLLNMIGQKIEGVGIKLAEKLEDLTQQIKNIQSVQNGVIANQQIAIAQLQDEVKQLRGSKEKDSTKEEGLVDRLFPRDSNSQNKPVAHKGKVVRVCITDEDVKLAVPTQSVAQRLADVAKKNNLTINWVQGQADATIVVQSYVQRPQEEEVQKKLKKYSGTKIALYLQINKDATKKAAPQEPLMCDFDGVYVFHFIGDKDGLHPNSHYQQEKEDELVKVLKSSIRS